MTKPAISSSDGGPAFPADAFAAQHCPGMSLRDWFAGQALNGLLQVCINDTLGGRPYLNHVAKHAYRMADEMLAERAKEPS